MTTAPSPTTDKYLRSVLKLGDWVERAGWKAYDPFDGLSSPYSKYFTFDNRLLKQIWLHVVRRFPINLRPLLKVPPGTSTKAMGFFAQGYLRLYETHRKPEYLEKATYCLKWLMENPSKGFKGYCWGNHFGGQTRGGYIAKGTPTIVWTGLIGQAFLDAFEILGDEKYAEVARSSCDFFLDELGWMKQETGICFQYYPNANNVIHNSSMIGASLLARVSSVYPTPRYVEYAEKAMKFTLSHQTEEGAWYYGVGPMWAWIDSFHTGYVLEAIHSYSKYTGDGQFDAAMRKGYKYFIETFFEEDGTPRYYHNKRAPLDIQCASHGVQALVSMREFDPRSVPLARTVADWTIKHMQDPEGYFYYRKYPFITNKTPTLHWGEATMFAALALLDHCLNGTEEKRAPKTKQRVS